MAQPTEEQIEAAAKAGDCADRTVTRIGLGCATEYWKVIAKGMAPYLQVPWDQPTSDEWKLFEIDHNRFQSSLSALRMFVQRRNEALKPKPVGPRVEKLKGILTKALNMSSYAPDCTNLAKEILDELDK